MAHLTGFATAAALLSSSIEYGTLNVYEAGSPERGHLQREVLPGDPLPAEDPMLALHPERG